MAAVAAAALLVPIDASFAASGDGAEVVATDPAGDYFTAPRQDPLATYSVPGVFAPTPASVISGGRRDESGTPGGEYWTSTFYAVLSNGVLQRTTVSREAVEPAPSTRTSVSGTPVGRGWAGMRRLVWASHPAAESSRSTLFALGDLGLYRYTVDEASGTVRSAGLVRGFGAVKGMTVLASTPRETVLLVNLSGGSLYTVTIAVGGTMSAVSTRVRASTWQGFEDLVSSSTGAGDPVLVTGIDTDTQRAYSYTVGAGRATATRIVGLGQRTGSYPATLRYGALSWDFSDFSPR